MSRCCLDGRGHPCHPHLPPNPRCPSQTRLLGWVVTPPHAPTHLDFGLLSQASSPSPGSLAQGMRRGEGRHPMPDPGPDPGPPPMLPSPPLSPHPHPSTLLPLPVAIITQLDFSPAAHLLPWLQSCPSSPHPPECARSHKLDHSTRPRLNPGSITSQLCDFEQVIELPCACDTSRTKGGKQHVCTSWTVL